MRGFRNVTRFAARSRARLSFLRLIAHTTRRATKPRCAKTALGCVCARGKRETSGVTTASHDATKARNYVDNENEQNTNTRHRWLGANSRGFRHRLGCSLLGCSLAVAVFGEHLRRFHLGREPRGGLFL